MIAIVGHGLDLIVASLVYNYNPFCENKLNFKK
jgi:hypothetical protein